MNIETEICCGSYYDALQAAKGGAVRIEVDSALHMGGLTPSISCLRLVKQHTDLQVMTMVRPRGGGFCYETEDFTALCMEASDLLAHGADGIVFGCLRSDATIDVEQTRRLVELAHEKGRLAVFHRAFDCTPDPYAAIEALISLGVDRILTSGQRAKAMEGAALLKQLQQQYKEQIELLAGSGLHAGNAVQFLKETGIRQLHSSCKDWKQDPTTMQANVSFAYASQPHASDYEVVSAEKVRLFIDEVNAYCNSEKRNQAGK